MWKNTKSMPVLVPGTSNSSKINSYYKFILKMCGKIVLQNCILESVKHLNFLFNFCNF